MIYLINYLTIVLYTILQYVKPLIAEENIANCIVKISY